MARRKRTVVVPEVVENDNSLKGFSRKLADFLKKHRKGLWINLAIILVALIAWITVVLVYENGAKKDQYKFDKLTAEYSVNRRAITKSEDIDKLLNEYVQKMDAVVSDAWGSVAKKGLLRIAVICESENELDLANKYYILYVNKDEDSLYAPMAYRKIAVYLENKKDYQGALAIYQKMEELYIESYYMPQVTYDLGRMYQVTGDKKKAIEYFNKVILENPKSEFSKAAKTRLMLNISK